MNKMIKSILTIVILVAMAVMTMGAESQGCDSKTTTGTGSTTTAATPATAQPVAEEPAPVPAPVDPAAYRAECKNIEFRALNKNPDSYMGQKYSVQGQVIQILESGNSTDIRLNVTPAEYGDYWTDTIYITYAGKTDALDKSIVNVYGTVAGKYTYESQANYNISLPLIDARYIDIVTL